MPKKTSNCDIDEKNPAESILECDPSTVTRAMLTTLSDNDLRDVFANNEWGTYDICKEIIFKNPKKYYEGDSGDMGDESTSKSDVDGKIADFVIENQNFVLSLNRTEMIDILIKATRHSGRREIMDSDE